LRAKAALAGPGHDQLTLELGQTTKHGQHQPAMSRRSIGPSILEALEAGTAIADGGQDVEQVPRPYFSRTTKSISNYQETGTKTLATNAFSAPRRRR
jgi:hypothetical protein